MSIETQAIQNISLTTMDGKKLSDRVEFATCKNDYQTCIQMNEVGQYIATIRLTDGEEVRYGIEVKPSRTFYYEVETLKEQLVDTYAQGTNFDIGKHKILTNDYEQIATITRDPRTNLFTAILTGDNVGPVVIEFERGEHSEYYQQTDLCIDVRKIGSIMNIEMHSEGYITDIRLASLYRIIGNRKITWKEG